MEKRKQEKSKSLRAVPLLVACCLCSPVAIAVPNRPSTKSRTIRRAGRRYLKLRERKALEKRKRKKINADKFSCPTKRRAQTWRRRFLWEKANSPVQRYGPGQKRTREKKKRERKG